MSKNYIRIDSNNNIIKSFSSDFEIPVAGDICVNENGTRHYNLNIYNGIGICRLKWDKTKNKIIELTDQEIKASAQYVDMINNKRMERMILLQMRITAGVEIGFDMSKEEDELAGLKI